MATGVDGETERYTRSGDGRMRMSAEEYGGGGESRGSEGPESDGEISVGCPSPAPAPGDSDEERDPEDDYFKPLKKLKMMRIDKVSYSIGAGKTKTQKRQRRKHPDGVKSFSILDILNHRPTREQQIVRPWDRGAEGGASTVAPPPPAHRGLLPPPPLLYRLPHPGPRPHSADLYETCSSGRSSTGGSDCCTSPDISAGSPTRHRQPQGPLRKTGKSSNTSPLDALFQMTSKTFEELNGDPGQDASGNALNLFNNRQQPKKKRKSRTAFTNHQIFELEKRFLYQKYLSPADRDEIAAQLGLSNAQVITWFQNRRAKLKRDMEELKKDVETAKVFSAHKSFLENVQTFSILKKKSPISGDEEKSQVVVEK